MNALTPTRGRFAKSFLLLCALCSSRSRATVININIPIRQCTSSKGASAPSWTIRPLEVNCRSSGSSEIRNLEPSRPIRKTSLNSSKPSRTQPPKILEIELTRGAMHAVELQLAGPSNLTGSAQWIGTATR